MRRHDSPGYLSNEVIDRADFLAACTDQDLGSVFTIAKKWGGVGFSASHIARQCGMSPGRVQDYMSGRVQAQSVEVFTRVADGLHIPGHLFGLGDRDWERPSAPVPASVPSLIPSQGGARLAQALTVAVAIVLRREAVLLVCRRDADATGITWQFPAGVVKPGALPETVAVHETLAETGVHCTVRENLGSRLHPITGVICQYVLCDYLTGEAGNNDTTENIDVTWVPRADIGRFIPAGIIFPPALVALELAT